MPSARPDPAPAGRPGSLRVVRARTLSYGCHGRAPARFRDDPGKRAAAELLEEAGSGGRERRVDEARPSGIGRRAARSAGRSEADRSGVLGPTGAYLVDRVGREGALAALLAVIVAWTALPLALATGGLVRRDG